MVVYMFSVNIAPVIMRSTKEMPVNTKEICKLNFYNQKLSNFLI